MNFKEIFNMIDDINSFLIVNDNLKNDLIKIKSVIEKESHKMFKFKILEESRLIEHFSFKAFDDIYVNNYISSNKSSIITNKLISYAKYDLENKNLELKDFINRNNKYLHKNESFLKKAEHYNYYVLGSDFIIKHFFNFHKINYEIIDYNFGNNPPTTYMFKTLEDEVFYLFEDISKRINDGVDINNIYVAGIDLQYFSYFEKFSMFYNIKFNLNYRESLYNLGYIREILNHEFSEIVEILKNIESKNFKFYNIRNINKNRFDTAINLLIEIINKYSHHFDKEKLKKIIIYDVKNTYLKPEKFTNAVNLITFEKIVALEKENIVYIVNAKYGSFPNLKLDDDYFTDLEKEDLNIPTSIDANFAAEESLEKIIFSNNVKYISFSKRDKYNEFVASDLFKKYHKADDYKTIYLKDLKNNALNHYKSYFSSFNNDRLLTNFTGEFKIEKSKEKIIRKYIEDMKIKITPTNLIAYLKFPFSFFLEKIIKIQIFEDSVNSIIGNFAHELIRAVITFYFPEKVKKVANFKNEKIDEYINKNKGDLDFELENFFELFKNLYFEEEINNLVNLRKRKKDKFSMKEELIIKILFFINKNKVRLTKALMAIIESESEEEVFEYFFEYSLKDDLFFARADIIRKYENNFFSITDYKLSNMNSLNFNKIKYLLQSIINDVVSVDIESFNLIQIIFYAYLYHKLSNNSFSYISFFSYFDDDLKHNGLLVKRENNKYFKFSESRIISNSKISEIYQEIDKVLNYVKKSIFDLKFAIKTKKDIKQKINLEYDLFSKYEALAFFNNNEIQKGEEDE